MLEILIRFLEAAALGALVGLEREVVSSSHKEDYDTPQSTFGGLRSYTLMALLGAVSVYLGDIVGSVESMIYFIGGAIFVFIFGSYLYAAFRHDQFGVTSEFAALLTFLIGALTMAGEIQVAVFLGITLTIMLAYKTQIAPLIDRIGKQEITHTLKFGVIALIILPLLPDTKYALSDMLVFLPHTAFTDTAFFNPYSIWFFVVVMSGVSYVGYILSRIFGSSKGIIFSGAIGGMVSSTAVTSAMAQKSTEKDHYLYPTTIATITACTIMLVRVIGIVMVFNPYLLGTLLVPIVIMIGLSVLSLAWLWKRSKTHATLTTEAHESPFQIGPALKFAGLIVVIKFFATLSLAHKDTFGEGTIYIVSFFSGLADVDAITQDMAEKSALDVGTQTLSNLTATIAILIALATNTATKVGLAMKFGSKQFSRLVMMILGGVFLAGGGVLIIMNWL